jgi:hypothetical protein
MKPTAREVYLKLIAENPDRWRHVTEDDGRVWVFERGGTVMTIVKEDISANTERTAPQEESGPFVVSLGCQATAIRISCFHAGESICVPT